MLNNVNLIGRLVVTPELQKTKNDKAYTRLKVAVSRRFKGPTGERQADFINVIFWGKLAETLVSYGGKGSLLSLEGEVRTYSYEDKNKEKHYVTEILGDRFNLLESKAVVAMRESKNNSQNEMLEAEELPF